MQEYSVVMHDPGSRLINTIKILRAIFGLGLKESKDIVDEATKHPVELCVTQTFDEAMDIVWQLESEGCIMECVPLHSFGKIGRRLA